MTHEVAVLQLTEYLQGRLTGQPHDDMSAHLAECGECQELAETCLVLASAPGGEGTIGAHPAADKVALFALRPAAIPVPERAGVALHVGHCASCRTEVDTSRAAIRDSERLDGAPAPAAPRRRAGRGGRLLALLAASLLLVLSGYSIARLMMSRELRETRAAIDATKRELRDARAWSGAVPLAVLTGEVRGEGPGETVRIEAGQPYVPIAVLPPLPGDPPPDERYRFEILSATGGMVWAHDMTGGAVRQQVAAAGVVTFLVPAEILAPGRYTLRALDPAAGGGRPVLEIPFAVTAAD